ncbi:MAG: hypothetical protein FWD68_02110 [Alphaproteobacteria bacterium]|nr:hypothetical protein [Alphaproteobacteria bacterium]
MTTIRKLRKTTEALLRERVEENVEDLYDEPMGTLAKWMANDPDFMKIPNVRFSLFSQSDWIYRSSLEKYVADCLYGSLDLTWLQLAQQSQSIEFICAATIRANNRQHRSAFVSLERFAELLARSVVLGWREDAELFARVGFNDVEGALDAGIGVMCPMPWFVVELFKDWLGASKVDLMTPFRTDFFENLGPWRELLANWRETDLEKFEKIMFRAADVHVAQSREAEEDDDDETMHFDVEETAYWMWPITLLAVLRLREWEGLKNPAMTHPLFRESPLGQLQEPLERQPNDLLTAAQERFGRENPGMFSLADLPRLRAAQGSRL